MGPGEQFALTTDGTAGRFEGIAEVEEQLGVLVRHDGLDRPAAEAGSVEIASDGLGQLVGSARIPAEIEDAGQGRSVCLYDTGGQVGSGKEDRHPVHSAETPKRDAFVRHTVLRADHRDLVRDGGQLFDSCQRVLALHGQNHDISGAKSDLVRTGRDRRRQGHRAVRRLQFKATVAQRVQMRPAGDENYIMAMLE